MEAGGILGEKNGIISSFYEDTTADVSYSYYQPDIFACESVINDIWNKNQIRFCGFIHTHRTEATPSEADKLYYKSILDSICNTENKIFLFIAKYCYESDNLLYAYSGYYNDADQFDVFSIPIQIID